MKIIYLFFFLLILSCSTVKKEYVCGDHPCVDNNEFNEYFSKNLVMEIKPQDKDKYKNKNNSLVKLNIKSSEEENIINKNSKRDDKIKAKIEKKRLKEEKKKLLIERKIKKKEKRNHKKKATKITKVSEYESINKKPVENKISNNRSNTKKLIDKTLVKKQSNITKPKKINTSNLSRAENMKNICDEIKDCDIDKIAQRLIEKGKKKPFPNIASN